MKKNKGEKKSVNIVNIIFWVVLAIVAIYAVVALTANDDGSRSFFGKTAFTVKSDSMSPMFEKGDLIFVNTDFVLEDIARYDIITFQAYIDVTGDDVPEWVYNSHEVQEVIVDDNGGLHFVTKGINNPEDDPDTVYQSQVIGVYTGTVWRNVGGVVDGIVNFLKSGTGFFIFIVIPCFAFLIYEIVKFVGVMTEYKTQQALSDRVKMQEEALAAARAQLEAEAKLKAAEEKEKE